MSEENFIKRKGNAAVIITIVLLFIFLIVFIFTHLPQITNIIGVLT